MFSGVTRGVGFESNSSVGGGCCAESAPPANASAASEIANLRVMVGLRLSRCRRARRRLHFFWTQDDLLRAPRGDFRHEQLIRITAVNLMNRAELAKGLARFAELPDDLAVELHLVDLAGD